MVCCSRSDGIRASRAARSVASTCPTVGAMGAVGAVGAAFLTAALVPCERPRRRRLVLTHSSHGARSFLSPLDRPSQPVRFSMLTVLSSLVRFCSTNAVRSSGGRESSWSTESCVDMAVCSLRKVLTWGEGDVVLPGRQTPAREEPSLTAA